MSLDAATLALVAGELKDTLLDAKIDKIFEPTRDEVLMTLRTRTETHRLLLSARSGSARVCLTKESFENPLTPPGFCMLLRKHLTGGRLIDLRREPGDRIVYFDFRCTNEMGDLVVNTVAAELMGRYSNLVLVQDGRIIDALKRVDFEDSEVRQLLPGLPYTLPPKPARPDFLATSAAAMVSAACEKDLPVTQALGKTVAGVGPGAGLRPDRRRKSQAGRGYRRVEGRARRRRHPHSGAPASAGRRCQAGGVQLLCAAAVRQHRAADSVCHLQRTARGLLRHQGSR